MGICSFQGCVQLNVSVAKRYQLNKINVPETTDIYTKYSSVQRYINTLFIEYTYWSVWVVLIKISSKQYHIYLLSDSSAVLFKDKFISARNAWIHIHLKTHVQFYKCCYMHQNKYSMTCIQTPRITQKWVNPYYHCGPWWRWHDIEWH